MTAFAAAQAFGDDPEPLAAECASALGATFRFDFGFIYATAPLSRDFGAVVEALRRRTGISSWCGTVGLGICGTGRETFEQPAISVLACGFGANACEVVALTADGRLTGRPKERSPPAIGIVHGDPRTSTITGMVSGLAQHTGTYLVGGLTSTEDAFPQAAGASLVEGGVSGVLLDAKGVQVSVGLTQGCSPIGPVRTVTEGEGQVIEQLDNRPAFEVLRDDAGGDSGGDPRRWLANVHAALPVAGSDKGDYVVRNLAGIDQERGLVAIGDEIAAGDRVMFVRRDRASAEADLKRMLASLKARTGGSVKAGLYFSCLARGPNLFHEPSFEARAIQAAFGDIPLAGFFGNGEIAHDRLYGYTGVLTLFS